MKNIFVPAHYLQKNEETKSMRKRKQYLLKNCTLQRFFHVKTWHAKWKQLVLSRKKICFLGWKFNRLMQERLSLLILKSLFRMGWGGGVFSFSPVTSTNVGIGS